MKEREKGSSVLLKERELLHKQLKLLAKKSQKCEAKTLALLSEQMVKVYLALNQPNY